MILILVCIFEFVFILVNFSFCKMEVSVYYNTDHQWQLLNFLYTMLCNKSCLKIRQPKI